jgi:hypothetical protein
MQIVKEIAPADISAIALGKNILADGCVTGKPVINIQHLNSRRHTRHTRSAAHHCTHSACTASAPVICSEATTREPMAAWIGICGRQNPAVKQDLAPSRIFDTQHSKR